MTYDLITKKLQVLEEIENRLLEIEKACMNYSIIAETSLAQILMVRDEIAMNASHVDKLS